MLSLFGPARDGYCDGVSRRDFLKVGGLALGGLSFSGLLQAESQAGLHRSHKAVIMVFLAGGPPHQDMFDMKPDAPEGIRGEFRPIPTCVPGIQICEHMPRLAGMMDRFAIVRSIVGAGPDHSAGQCLTGYKDLVSKAQGGRPSLGALVSQLKGPVHPDVPVFVGLSPRTGEPRWGNPGDPGYLGLAHAPFTPFRSESRTSQSNGAGGGANLDAAALDATRLAGRRSLLAQLDGFRRAFDNDDAVRGMDSFTQRAFEVLTSRRVYDALDVTREDPKVRARYGGGDAIHESDGPPAWMDQFLMARRLVEAGARVVTLGFGRWDTHSRNFSTNRTRIPKLDMALSALLEDLYDRGLDRDVSVIVWGEFGRTPKINENAGRDHFPNAWSTVLAGGGLRGGQAIGDTGADGEQIKNRPVSVPDLLATIVKGLGIDPMKQNLATDGRPIRIVDIKAEPIKEILG